jgi:hypothetical protein
VDTILKLAPGEEIVNCIVPAVNTLGEYPLCQVCGKVAYRVIAISADGASRQVPLCGGHFISACLQEPALRRFDRGGKMG